MSRIGNPNDRGARGFLFPLNAVNRSGFKDGG